jgi:CBS domain containing-hemolysin-like protein
MSDNSAAMTAEKDTKPGSGDAGTPRRAGNGARENPESWSNRLLRAVFGWSPTSIRSDLQVLLEGEGAETGFSPDESRMLKNILSLRERRVDDVMVPRTDIVAVHQDVALGDLLKVFKDAAHSRLVVYNDTLDDPIGMVHIRDMIAFMMAQATVATEASAARGDPHPAGLNLSAVDLARPLSTTKIVRTMLFVPPSMPAIDLLAKMQATRIHLALVIDEYGGTEGIVSIEDIVEEIVGEIDDEHDEAAAKTVIRQSDGSFIAVGRASLEEALAVIGPEFDVGKAAEEVDTVAGYIVTLVDRVPVRGELISGPGTFEIEVLDADPRRVKRVRIYPSRERRRVIERTPARRADPRSPATAAPTPDPGEPPFAEPPSAEPPSAEPLSAGPPSAAPSVVATDPGESIVPAAAAQTSAGSTAKP